MSIPLILWGAFAGVVVGAGLRWGLQPREKIDSSSKPPDSASPDKTSVIPVAMPVLPGARPDVEDVLEASGIQLTSLMVRYLREASIDEVIGLLERIEDGEGNLRDVSWLIYRRGVTVDPVRLVAWAVEHENHRQLLRTVFSSWGSIDPEAALAASEEHTEEIRESVIRGISEIDHDRAILLLEKVAPDSRLLPQLRRRQMDALANESPESALETAVALPDKAERERAIGTAILAWSKKDPLAALHWIESRDELAEKNRLFEFALRAVAESDPLLARRKLESMPASRERSRLEGDIAEVWSRKDPEGALGWIRDLPKSGKRDYLFGSISKNLDASPRELLALLSELEIDPSGASEILRIDIDTEGAGWSFGGGSSDLARQTKNALAEMAKESPMEALGAVSKIPMSAHTQADFVQGIVAAWAAKEPGKAADWARALPETPLAVNLLRAVLQPWADEAPADAARFLREHHLVHRHPELGINLVERWAAEDPEAAVAWADSLEVESRSKVLSKAIEVTAQYDPQMAIEHVDALPAADQLAGVEAIADAWQANDPGATFEWLYAQSAEMDLGKAIQDTSKTWVLAHAAEASEWIGGLEPGPSRDHAVAGMVQALIMNDNPDRDFAAAEAWVGTISDEGLRTEWLDQINRSQGLDVEASDAGGGAGIIGGAAGATLEVETPSISVGGIEIR